MDRKEGRRKREEEVREGGREASSAFARISPSAIPVVHFLE